MRQSVYLLCRYRTVRWRAGKLEANGGQHARAQMRTLLLLREPGRVHCAANDSSLRPARSPQRKFEKPSPESPSARSGDAAGKLRAGGGYPIPCSQARRDLCYVRSTVYSKDRFGGTTAAPRNNNGATEDYALCCTQYRWVRGGMQQVLLYAFYTQAVLYVLYVHMRTPYRVLQ